MDSAQAAGLTLTVVGVAGTVFSQALPPPYTIAEKPASAEASAYVRSRATQAAVLVAMIGGGAALFSGSVWPLAGAGAMAAWLWWQYGQAADLDGLWG